MKPVDVVIVGGGMITNDQLLPSVYHLQRLGVVGEITICARHNKPLRQLRDNADFAEAFPDQQFTAMPALDEPDDAFHPSIDRDAIATLKPHQAVIIATPDQAHYSGILTALEHDQHVLCVKPLVMNYADAVDVERRAREKGLFVGVEYHKRFDRRALLAKREFERGRFGDFVIGEARLLEPYYYRYSNFQNWFTCDQTDPFVYIGCHYVDQLYFITGLRPTSVSIIGIRRPFPNGNDAYMWSSGRVTFENGGVLTVTTGLGYPDDGGGSNDQGVTLYFENDGRTTMFEHNDQFRGVTHTYPAGLGPGGSTYNYVNPDYFKLVPWNGPGYQPVGYGYDSVAENLITIQRIAHASNMSTPSDALACRQRLLNEVDDRGIIATPANSFINELVTEAARLSIQNDGALVDIHYTPEPHVKQRVT